jgi:hypothetical protein
MSLAELQKFLPKFKIIHILCTIDQARSNIIAVADVGLELQSLRL